jgi:hypothetical protein
VVEKGAHPGGGSSDTLPDAEADSLAESEPESLPLSLPESDPLSDPESLPESDPLSEPEPMSPQEIGLRVIEVGVSAPRVVGVTAVRTMVWIEAPDEQSGRSAT